MGNMKESEIAKLITENKEEAYGVLKKEFENLVYKLANNTINKYSNMKALYDDLVQEGFIGLNDAINKFKPDNGNKFITFAYIVIDRKMKVFMRKHITIYNNEQCFDDLSIQEAVAGYCSEKYSENPNYLYFKEYENERIMKAFKKLERKEQIIVKYKLKGYSYTEIGRMVNLSKKQVDYQLQKIKKKLYEYIMEF